MQQTEKVALRHEDKLLVNQSWFVSKQQTEDKLWAKLSWAV